MQGKVIEGTEEPVDWSFAVLELLREEQGVDIKEMNNRYMFHCLRTPPPSFSWCLGGALATNRTQNSVWKLITLNIKCACLRLRSVFFTPFATYLKAFRPIQK